MRNLARLRALVSSDSVTMAAALGALLGDTPSRVAQEASRNTAATPKSACITGVCAVGKALLLGSGCDGLRAGRMQNDGSPLGHALGRVGAVLDVACQLAARGVDVIATGLPNRGDNACFAQYLGEGQHPGLRRTQQARCRKRIEGDQVE